MAIENPLEYAIQLEKDGLAFYSEAAENTESILGRKMFESLAGDETRHIAILENIAKLINVEIAEETPKERIVTLFSTLGPEMREQLGANPSDTDVVEKALATEKRAVEFYEEQAREIADMDHKVIFMRLADEERQHVEILQNTLMYLNDTGHWFLWNEQGMLDGG
ncbi:ferritin family protein [bacterium]|nr:ferritin family protein [bacterium]